METGGRRWAQVHERGGRDESAASMSGLLYVTQLEKEMTTHSSTPAWRILWTAEPGGLPSMGSHRVGHD